MLNKKLLAGGVKSIKITRVNIPTVIEAGTSEPNVLDCVYDLEGKRADDLVIKWFINQEILYQWILGSEPRGSQEFEKYIDQTYKASNDMKTMYRAVKLIKPGHELTGSVRCVISTTESEDSAERNMLIYCK